MAKLLVSVIIPTYNYGHYLSEAIESILDSDFSKDQIEILVIDDGSTDQTQEIVDRYGKRVTYFYQENSGKAWATKVGIDLSQGKYVFNLDADDWFLPSKIREVVRIFEGDPELVHVAHPAIIWNQSEGSKGSELLPEHLLERKLQGRCLLSYFYRCKMLFGGGSTFAARADILKSFPIPKSVDMFIDEYLILCTLNKGYSYFMEKPLSIWRVHGKNYSDTYSDSVVYKAKMERSLSSMKAVLGSLNQSSFDSELYKIYSLKLEIMGLAVKEDLGEKTLADIWNLWGLFLNSFHPFQLKFFQLMKAYTVLNRSLPTPLIKFLQKAKRFRFS